MDSLRRLQKVTSKTYEHNLGGTSSAFQRDLDDLLRKSAASASVPVAPDAQADMLKSVDSMLSKMRGLKRKLSELSTQSDAAVHVARTRTSYLASVPESMDDAAYKPWARQRLSHHLADFFLRSTPPLKGSALTFAKEERIEELVDFELWAELAKAESGLREGRLDEVLAWTGENRTALKKAKVRRFSPARGSSDADDPPPPPVATRVHDPPSSLHRALSIRVSHGSNSVPEEEPLEHCGF